MRQEGRLDVRSSRSVASVNDPVCARGNRRVCSTRAKPCRGIALHPYPLSATLSLDARRFSARRFHTLSALSHEALRDKVGNVSGRILQTRHLRYARTIDASHSRVTLRRT